MIIKKSNNEKIYRSGGAGNWTSDLKERGFCDEIDHFFNCIVSRKQPITNAFDALQTHELIEKLVVAAGLNIDDSLPNDWDKIARWG